MNSIILFQQLLVLLGMMLTGYIAFKSNIIDEHSYQKLSSLVVKILNPFLMISGVVGKTATFSNDIIAQNLILVIALYVFLFLVGFIYIKLMRITSNESYLYRMLILLPNVGFMGIPIIKESLGSEYIVLVAFYILGFNIIAYSYGIDLSCKYGNKATKLDWRNYLSPGMLCAIAAITIFFLQLQLPQPVVIFFNYMGEACIVMSMIVIGAFLARMDLRKALLSKDSLLFILAFMVIVPLLMILLSKNLSFDRNVLTVFHLMACMPIGSVTCMLAQEYGGDGSKAAQLIASTTISTIITAPLVFYLTSFI